MNIKNDKKCFFLICEHFKIFFSDIWYLPLAIRGQTSSIYTREIKHIKKCEYKWCFKIIDLWSTLCVVKLLSNLCTNWILEQEQLTYTIYNIHQEQLTYTIYNIHKEQLTNTQYTMLNIHQEQLTNTQYTIYNTQYTIYIGNNWPIQYTSGTINQYTIYNIHQEQLTYTQYTIHIRNNWPIHNTRYTIYNIHQEQLTYTTQYHTKYKSGITDLFTIHNINHEQLTYAYTMYIAHHLKY